MTRTVSGLGTCMNWKFSLRATSIGALVGAGTLVGAISAAVEVGSGAAASLGVTTGVEVADEPQAASATTSGIRRFVLIPAILRPVIQILHSA